MGIKLFSTFKQLSLAIMLTFSVISLKSEDFNSQVFNKLLEAETCNLRFTAATKKMENKMMDIGTQYSRNRDVRADIEEYVNTAKNKLNCFERYNLSFFYSLNLYKDQHFDAAEKLFKRLQGYKQVSENNSKILRSRLRDISKKKDRRLKELKEVATQRDQEARRIAAAEDQRQRDQEARRIAAAEDQRLKKISKQIRKEEGSRKNINSIDNKSINNIKTKVCNDNKSNTAKNTGRTGVKRRCYLDNSLYSVTSYKEGKKDGLEETYFQNGKVKNKKYFSQGKLNGYEENYLKGSRFDKEGNEVFDSNGNLVQIYYLSFKGYYQDGLKEGDHTFYYSNRIIKKALSYKKGVLNGEYKSFSSNGNLKEKIIYSKGIYDGTFEQYKVNGSPIVKLNYKKGKKNGLEEIFNQKTEQIEVRTYFVQDVMNGIFEEYYPDGVIRASGKFRWGKRDGEWQAYYFDGTLAVKSLYRNGRLEGSLEEYYEDGALKKITNYSFGKKNGKEKNFDKDGKITDTSIWRSGKLQE